MRRVLAAATVLTLGFAVPAQGTATPYGAGCTAAAARAFGFAPNPGAGELLLYQTGVVAGSVPFAALGFSATNWGGATLPLPLTSLGLPTCSLLAEPVALVGANAPAGVAEFELAVPAATTLLGSQLFAQWVNGGDGSLGGGLPLTLSEGVAFTFGTALGMPGFAVVGDPTSAGGATWTYVATNAGVAYDLRGKLYKPSTLPVGGFANHPAVVISHGFGGNVNGYSSQVAASMRSWGLVCIMVNLTHAANVPLGSPGLATEVGSSAANVLRNRKCVDLLQSLGYVDMRRLAAHGHSMGGFATGALLGSHPALFLVASHTAAGMSTQAGAAATSVAQAQAIRAPYSLHHGDADTVVPLALDQALANQLAANPTTHQLTVYPGFTHTQIATNAGMLAAVRAWYVQHGLLP